MHETRVIGIDPGLVHTGCVELLFQPEHKHLTVRAEPIAGPDTDAVLSFIHAGSGPRAHIFIEDYNPRSNFNTDKRMMAAVSEMVKSTGGKRINNTGVKKVVRREVMNLLHLWSFSQVTHHMDLRSAGYILVYGMLKDELLNRVLFDLLVDHINGNTWTVKS